jgi:hypothetical protein
MIVSAAAVSAATIPDPLDHLGLVQYLIFFSFAIAGWACSELKTLAAWVGGTPETRLEIVQKFVIALCAGVGMAMLVQAGVPWYWGVDAPKIASRGGAFLAAYGGTRTLNALFDSAINVAQGTVERLRQGRQDPPRPPGP